MNELIEFSLDTENDLKNYNLAKWYEEQKHFAPAHTYYLRAAERSFNELLSYECLLRSSFCYRKQDSRDATEKVALENALMLLPERPEAYYFLSLFYERKQEWQNVYIYASLGLRCYDNPITPLNIPEFKNKYGLLFQKAVAAWWWGRGKESRTILQELVNCHWGEMDETHKLAVEKNITQLGSGPESQAFRPYNKQKLRFEFENLELIENNYSQIYQDIFVLSMLNGKKNGTFLEIGAAEPFKGSNTALLEKTFGWSGVSIEYDQKFIENYKKNRSSILLHANALDLDYEEVLSNFNSNTIDYLQLDIEPAKNTYECLLKIPFNKYRFAVITYEHDYYVDVTRSYRKNSREFLESKGYLLVVNDLSPDGESNFEDWWVHPDLVDPEIVSKMLSISDKTQAIEDYILES
jgi:hypothetical protein